MRSITHLMASAALAALAVHGEQTEEWKDGEERPDVCYGIALSDAEDFGPYQAGALRGLLKHQMLTGEHYAITTGVALGALNAYIIATHKPSQHVESIDFLKDFWMDIAGMDAYANWTGGFVYGFFFEKGIYDAKPIS